MLKLRLFLASSLLFAGMMLLGGCAKNKLAPARVSGSVSYKGQPIKAGAMRFHTSEGTPYDAQISPDGTYNATDLPEGEMVVTIDTEGLNPDRKAAGKDAEKRSKIVQQKPPSGVATGPTTPTQFYIKLPAKYANAKTSPLTVTLSSGRQVHNFDLPD